MAKSIYLRAEVCFFKSSLKWIRFPIESEIRLSLGVVGQQGMLPSAIYPSGVISSVDTDYLVDIVIPEWDSIEKSFQVGTEFSIGSSSLLLGKGKVLSDSGFRK